MYRLWLVCLAAVALWAVQLSAQQAPTFRGTTDNVPVFVTVTDRSGRLVTSLTGDDFSVFDNGRRQPLTVFDSSPQPLRLIVMLDVSGSMYGNLPLLRAASEQLFTHLGPEDLALVGTFGATIDISPTFTRDAAELVAALPDEIRPDAPTPLWNAVDAALDAFGDVDGRRVVLVLSDGKDSGPLWMHRRYVTVIEVMERAQREEVMVYGVGLRSRLAPRARQGFIMSPADLAADLPDAALGTLALETGGGYFEIRASDDLGATFLRVVEELRSQYLLGFVPPDRDGKRHKIQVRLATRGLTARARKNYIAPKDQ
jgi:Ca-activated chloride channel homolog